MLTDLLIFITTNYVYVSMSVYGYVYLGTDSHRGQRYQIPTRYWEPDLDHPEEQCMF